ncbi:MAG TPA: sigma 54-interacting transcriptional regulator [Pyrinomonadaceae bacterium]|jgi:Nif-specific regulatory protein|nr:sigma 54-interacting transcriptional regulator [Pyrinomonadaceae bacterium]
MSPHLIAISGNLKGTTFSLASEDVSIGRDASNSIRLNDASVSRRHCLITRKAVDEQSANRVSKNSASAPDEDATFTILDLDSYNGTFVNGVPVHEQTLAHGDQIALGDVQLLFLLDETEADPTSTIAEADLITRSTVRLRAEDALYLRPDSIVAGLPKSDRIGRDLATLLKISNSIGTIADIAQLQTYLLEAVNEVISAERLVIVLTERTSVEIASTTGWSKFAGRNDALKPSRSITQQVLREGVALLSNDLFANDVLGARASLAEANVCSVLCVPLIVLNETLGVIYLDTSDTAARFDEDDLQLMTAIAGIAAMAFANARQVASLENENERLRNELNITHQLVGQSQPLNAVLQFIAKVAPADSTVLIHGESGTGKELAARAIHVNSRRATKPFVAINCATLTETLIESELFGHEKGSFTGAIAQKRGKLEVADGGTLFLDEVAELSPLMQAKLLRVLQEREFERVGGTRPIKIDVRIIAATNQDLRAAIKSGKFREDLYYRLNVVSIVMPALRDRREDISLLANYFVSVYSKRCKRKVRGISEDARQALQNYDWPGNVRELGNAIERAVVLGVSDLIVVDDLPERLVESAAPVSSAKQYHQGIAEAKKALIVNALREAKGNYTEAAKTLGIHPNNLHRLIKTLNLKSEIANS